MVSCNKYYIFLAFLILGTLRILWLNISYLYGSKQFETENVVLISDDQIKFNAYLTIFNKSYFGEEYVKRFGNFKKSLEEISFLNGENGTGAKHGLTKFSDLSKAEFAQLMHNPAYGADCRDKYVECGNSSFLRSDGSEDFIIDDRVADEWDWRRNKSVGPVLNQKLCQGCWAFGVVGVMESMEVIQGIRPYTPRSVQELIDCSTYNEGCKGGHVTLAMEFLCYKHMGIITQDEYPLKLIKDPCNWTAIKQHKRDGRGVKRFRTACNMNEKEIVRKINKHGPVMVVINADPLQHYTGRIIRRACYRSRDNNSIDHIVQIIGYNLKNEIPYYIIKNSWGEDFGDNGYANLAIGYNVCGISDEVSYLEVN